MTILTAIREACPDLGFEKPLSVVTATDANSVRLLDFAHDAGDDIARRGDWSRMLVKTSAASSPYPVPDNFARLVPGGAVNRISPSFEVVRGPLSSDQLANFLAGRFGVSQRLYYGMSEGNVVFSRALVSEAVEINWVRKEWLLNSGTYKTRATSDDDTCLFPERLLTKALIWRFRRETGLVYEDQLAEWEADLAMELRQDRGVTV